MMASVGASDAATAPAAMYILAVATVRPVHRSESRWRPSPTPRPCARCSRRRDLHLRLEGDAGGARGRRPRPPAAVGAQLGPRRPDAVPVRGTRAADDRHAVPGCRRRPVRLPRATSAASRHAASSGSASAPRWCAPASRPLLAEACRDERMPLFEVPYRTPFIAVARANAEAIAAQSYARRSWALAAQRAIALAALRPDGLGATLAELARQLDTWVGMFDAAGDARARASVARSSPTSADELRAEVGVVLRRGARAGSSLRIGGTPLHAADARPRRAPARCHRDGRRRSRPGGPRRRHRRHRDGRARPRAAAGSGPCARRCCARGWCSRCAADDPALARRIARDLWGGLPAAPILVAVTDAAAARGDAVRELARAARRRAQRRAVLRSRRRRPRARRAGTTIADALDEFAERFEVRHRRLRPDDVRRLLGRHRSGARWPATAARDSVSHFADVARTGVLSVRRPPRRARSPRPTLAPLVRHDAEQGTALLETVRVWLDDDCSHEASARALGVHRHTVRARIAAAERALGTRSRRRSATRAELWAALAPRRPDPHAALALHERPGAGARVPFVRHPCARRTANDVLM